MSVLAGVGGVLAGSLWWFFQQAPDSGQTRTGGGGPVRVHGRRWWRQRGYWTVGFLFALSGLVRLWGALGWGGVLLALAVTGVILAAMALGFLALGLNRDTSIISPALTWVLMQLDRWWRRRREARQAQ